MSIDRPTLEESTDHAERFGSQLVHETAPEGYLDATELGLLSLALQRLDRRWRLPREQRARLALALCDARLPHARICEMAQLSRATPHRLRHGAQHVPKRRPIPRNHAEHMSHRRRPPPVIRGGGK